MQYLLLVCLLAVLAQQGAAFAPRGFLRSSSSINRVTSQVLAENKGHVDHISTLSPQPKSTVVEAKARGRARWIVPSVLSLFTVLALGGQPANANVIDQLNQAAENSGFLQSFLLIFISEIGDKTFFIAGLLAAKYGRVISFTGSIGALAVMTVISTVIGQLFHAVPASFTQGIPFDDYAAVAAFSYFGIKTLLDASKLEDGDSSGMDEEKQDAEQAVAELTTDEKRDSAIRLIGTTFSLVFAAEIGDRSFLSTIALSAAQNPYAVAAGAILAHASATGVAVLGGAFLSKYLSEKVIGYIGGSLFIIFAVTTAFGIF